MGLSIYYTHYILFLFRNKSKHILPPPSIYIYMTSFLLSPPSKKQFNSLNPTHVPVHKTAVRAIKKKFRRHDHSQANLRNLLISTHSVPLIYFTLDIRQTHSTWLDTSILMSGAAVCHWELVHDFVGLIFRALGERPSMGTGQHPTSYSIIYEASNSIPSQP